MLLHRQHNSQSMAMRYIKPLIRSSMAIILAFILITALLSANRLNAQQTKAIPTVAPPVSLALESQLFGVQAYHIAMPYLYTLSGRSINIYDLSDLSSPLKINHVEVPQNVLNFAATDQAVYVAHGESHIELQRIDLTTPAGPITVTEHSLAEFADNRNQVLRAMAPFEDYLLIAQGVYSDTGETGEAYPENLILLDLTTAITPTAISTVTYNVAGDIYELGLYGREVYFSIIDSSVPRPDNLYDIRRLDYQIWTDPQPTLQFIPDRASDFFFYDIMQQASNQSYLLTFQYPDCQTDSEGNLSCTSDEIASLSAFDVSQPMSITRVGKYYEPGYEIATRPGTNWTPVDSYRNDIAYVVREKLYLLEGSNPAALRLRGSIDFEGDPIELILHDGVVTARMLSADKALKIYSITPLTESIIHIPIFPR